MSKKWNKTNKMPNPGSQIMVYEPDLDKLSIMQIAAIPTNYLTEMKGKSFIWKDMVVFKDEARNEAQKLIRKVN